jgi:hypothetical protein
MNISLSPSRPDMRLTSRVFWMKAQYRADTGKAADTVSMSFETHRDLRREIPWLDVGDRVLEFADMDIKINNQIPRGLVVCSRRITA